MGNYELEVDPGALRLAKRRYAQIAEAVGERARRVRGTPDEIGDDWQGSSAITVKADMAKVATLLGVYRGHLHDASEAVGALATAYENALETIGRLNTRYDDAVTDCESSLTQLGREQDDATKALTADGRRTNMFEQGELSDIYAGKRTAATQARDRTIERLDARYLEVVEECRYATTICAGNLALATYVTVPADITLNLSNPEGAKAAYLAMYDAAEERLGDDLGLLQDRDEADDGDKMRDRDRVEELIYNYRNMGTDGREDLLEILRRHQGDPEFAGMLSGSIDVRLLGNAMADAQDTLHGLWDEETSLDDVLDYNDQLAQALGPLLGLGTFVQGDFRPPDGKDDEWYDALTAAYQGSSDVRDGSQTILATLMIQGTWDPGFLAGMTERLVRFEREDLDGADGWWARTGGATAVAPDGYYLDPVQALATAVGKNRTAAQMLLRSGGMRDLELEDGTVQVNDLMAYLLLDRGWEGNQADALEGLLKTALSEKPGDLVPLELGKQLQQVVAYGEEQTEKAEAEARKNDRPWYVDLGHGVLDVAGLVPFLGEPFDLANAGWYEAEGRHLEAGLTAAGAVPGLGYGAIAGKYGLKGAKALEGLDTLRKAEVLATLNKHIDTLGHDATYAFRIENGVEMTVVELKNAEGLAKALSKLEANSVYELGELTFKTDDVGRLVVKGEGGMRRFMELGQHFKHLPAGTELKYSGHTFKMTPNGDLELLAVNRFKPIWGHGEAFNIQNWHKYTHNEIYLDNTRRLDSYDPGRWMVERKYRQYGSILDRNRLTKDLDLIEKQYSRARTIPETAGNAKHFPNEVNKNLTGNPLLEIPPQLKPLDPKILRDAASRNPPITIRDTDGKIYTPQFPSGR